MSRRCRKNVLLAKPPGQYHYLSQTRVDPKLYEGVHTTSSFEIAAAYAFGTNGFVARKHPNTYPVVVELDVGGLRFEPDVDAYHQVQELFNISSYDKQRALKELAEGKTVDDLAEDAFMDGGESECSIGDNIACFIFEDNQHNNVYRAFIDFYGANSPKAQAAYVRWVKTGKYDKRLLTFLVDQRRYLVDFDLDRLVRVVAFQPWWDEMMEYYEDEQQERIERIENAGYAVYTLESLPIGVRDDKVLYDSGDKPKDTQYHGTSAALLAAAFPMLPLPAEPPFPVSEVEEGNDE